MTSFEQLLVEQTTARAQRFLQDERKRKTCSAGVLNDRLKAHLRLYVPRRLADTIAQSLTRQR